MDFFVTAIDTDSGKTLVSAILCEALHADYWKPVQAGLPRDADVVKDLVTNKTTTIHPERYILQHAMSPHAAARLESITIRTADFTRPSTSRDLIIEGAGGCLVPLNDTEFVIDLVPKLNAEIILVADLYLGSINHTLLTVEALRTRGLNPLGIIFNGEPNTESERIICHHSGLKVLLHIGKEPVINRQMVKKYAEQYNRLRTQ
ncbi:MAG: dethiobiotin synthase [Bacteroidota bacterium]|jgi:dethiobiotin synthetase|nr:MAG: dethiobiotin synthase [Bacteroidota bacterium]